MNKSILQQLFDGKIFPSEAINPNKPNSEAREIIHAISDGNEYFSKILSKRNRKRFDKLNEMQNVSAGIYGSECFAYGFRLGAALLIEVMHDINFGRK